MTNLTEVSAWDAGVYEFLTTDPVQGGPGGIDNSPHQSLANRALWLRNRIAAAIIQAGQADGATDNQQLVEAIVLQVASVPALRLVPIPLVPNTQTVLVLTRGQNADSDGLGATYKWSYGSGAVDDGKTIVTPSSLPGAGRWLVCGINASALGGQLAAYYATTLNVAAAVAPLAPLASPPLTGTPTTPTAAAGDSSSTLANTQFVARDFVSHTGIALVWNANPNTYYKLATLPATTSSTADSVTLKATLNSGYTAANDTMLEGIFGNRGGFGYVYNVFGPNNPATCIKCFRETDGTVSIYAECTASQGFATVTMLNAGVAGAATATLYPVPASTTTPTGTLIFSSAAPLTYPPFLNVSSPLSYLTPAVAALTYLPKSGGTVTGSVVIANADLTVYSAGGTTGVVYLNAAKTAYLFFDGTQFVFGGASTVATTSGALASAASVTAAQAAAIASSNATTTAALTNYVPKAGGNMTGVLNVAANVSITAGDLTSYRAGGASGIIYLDQAHGHYVFWNGTSYFMPGGELFVNGFQMARLASPGFSGTPTAPTPPDTDDSTKLATTAFVRNAFGGGGVPGNPGYQYIGGGLIMQWGAVAVPASGGVAVTFPLRFPHAVYVVTATPISGSSSGAGMGAPFVFNESVAGFSIDNLAGSVIVEHNWIALGN